MGVRFLRNGSSSSGNAELNLFVQQNEPENKNGIWLQEDGLIYEDVVAENNIYISEGWDTIKANKLTSIPYSFSGRIANIGGYIYLIGGDGGKNNMYKYDPLTDTYTQLSNIPYEFDAQSGATSVGTDIFLFGTTTANYRNTAYKYDTLTDTYTQLSNIPVDFFNGDVVAVGNDIYLLGGYGNSGGYSTRVYKYDIINDTYAYVTTIPFKFYGGSATVIDTDIYVLGSSYESNNAKRKFYKYNTIERVWTQLADYTFGESQYNRCISVGNDIYIFRGLNSPYKAYKYEPYTNTYTQLANIPKDFYNGALATVIGENGDVYIYLFFRTYVQLYLVKLKDYPNNSIILSQGVPTYHTNLLRSNVENGLQYYFNNAWHYTTAGKLNETIPTYYGNGTSWVKFKN